MAEIDTRPRSAPLAPDFNHAQRSSSLDYALASTSRNPSYGNVVVTVAGPSSSSTNEEQLTTDFGSSAGGGSSLYGSLLSAGASLDLSASQPSLLDDGQLLSSTGDLTAGLSTLPDGLLQLPDFNDEDLSASSRLEFPEVPAMLFEQAPEYEYSAHTRANVFSDASLDRLVAGALSSGGYHYDAPLGRSPAAPDHNLWNQMTDVPGPSAAFDHHQQPQPQQQQQFALLPADGAAEERINSANGSVGASSSFLGGEGVVESSGAAGASGAASGASSYPQHHTAPEEHPTAYHRHHPTHHHHHQQYHEHRSYPPSQGGANAYAQQRYSEPMAAPVSVHEGSALDERGYQRSWADIPDYGQDGQPLIKRRRGSPSSAMIGRRESPRPWAGGQDTHGSSAASTTSHRAPYHTSFAPPVPVSDVSPADTAAAAALTTPSVYQPTLPRSGPSPAMAYAALPPRAAPRSGHSPTPRYAQAGSHHLYTDWAGSAGPSANAYARQPPGPGYHHHPSSSPSSAFAAHSQFRSDPSTWGAAHHHGSTSNGGGGANGRGRSQPRRASSGSVTGNGNDSDDGEGGSVIDAPPPTERAVSLAQAALKGGNGTAQQADMLAALNDTLASSLETDGVARCPFPNCTKTFAKNRSYNLKTHLRSHSQLKPFACASCPRAFSRKHDLERHARVHSGDKPYICEVCGRGFPRSDALRRHWRVEKECGDKASEIEAGQPLPSVPPGATGMNAHAHALAAHAHAHPATMSMPLKQMMPGQHGVFAAPTSMPGPWHHGGGAGGGPQYGLPPQQQQQQQRGPPPPSGQQGSQAPPPGFVPLPPSHHLSVGTKRPREDW